MMLLEFKWEGFSKKTLPAVARMSKWLGVKGYSFKFAILTAAASTSSDLRLAQHIAGHRSTTSTQIYTRLALIADSLRLAEKIIVPGLNRRFGEFEEEASQTFLNSLEIRNFRYNEFPEDWLEKLMKWIYGSNYNLGF